MLSQISQKDVVYSYRIKRKAYLCLNRTILLLQCLKSLPLPKNISLVNQVFFEIII